MRICISLHICSYTPCSLWWQKTFHVLLYWKLQLLKFYMQISKYSVHTEYCTTECTIYENCIFWNDERLLNIIIIFTNIQCKFVNNTDSTCVCMELYYNDMPIKWGSIFKFIFTFSKLLTMNLLTYKYRILLREDSKSLNFLLTDNWRYISNYTHYYQSFYKLIGIYYKLENERKNTLLNKIYYYIFCCL